MSPHPQSDDTSASRTARKRQIWTIIFAIIVIWVARTTSAQSPPSELAGSACVGSACASLDCTCAEGIYQSIYYGDANPVTDWTLAVSQPIQLDGTTGAPMEPAALHRNGPQAEFLQANSDARPRSLQIAASLSNFDADASPDGWRVQLVLRDQEDRPVHVRAQARFKLTPRGSRFDSGRLEDAKPIQWSMAIEFSEDEAVRLKLPLRRSLRARLGWPSDSALRSLTPSTSSRSPSSRMDRDWYTGMRYTGMRYTGSRSLMIRHNLRDRVMVPEAGELSVRVSVPTAGTFEATTTVWIRPPVLVDTRWPLR